MILIVAGCATSPERQARIALAESSMPVCNGEEDCKAKWDAAQLWVVNNSAYRLQIATDVVLETYPATDYTVRLAMRVTKEPLGEGNHRINLIAYCANLLGCDPDPVESKIAFNNYVSSITP